MDSTNCLAKRRSTDNANNSMVSLPMDIIIESILNKLDVVDFHCFSAVCRSWRSIAIAAKKSLPLNLQPQLPWLMLSSRASHPRFFSVSHGKTFRQKLVEARGTRCYGSSWGWLIMADHRSNIFLLNPFTRIQIQLPKEAIFPIVSEDGVAIQGLYRRRSAHWLQDRKCIRKAMLFSPPTVALATPPSSNSHLVMPSLDCVVIVMDDHGSLSFCRLADKVWTDTVNCGYVGEFRLLDIADSIFYNGHVFAIDRRLDLVQVELGPCPKFTSCNIDRPPMTSSTFVYLVECRGELLMVIRCYDLLWVHDYDAPSGTAALQSFPKTIGFEIFKLDTKARCWIPMENLDDQILFVGSCSNCSVSALDYPGMRGNCIYYTEDALLEKMPQDCNDTGVFYLEDKSFKRLFLEDEVFTFSKPVWFTPISWWEEVPSGFLHGVEMRKCQ